MPDPGRSASEHLNGASATLPAGTTPPHSIPAEQSVLGAVLLSDRCLPALIVEEGLRPEHFFRDRHRVIFAAMIRMDEAGHPVDHLTLAEHLSADGKFEEVGGQQGLDELMGGVPGLGGLRRYAQIVREHALARDLLNATYEIQAGVLNHQGSPRELVERAERAILQVAQDSRGRTSSLADPEAFAEHIFEWLQEEQTMGLPLPADWGRLREMVRLRPGHVTVIAGWSGAGKSVAAAEVAEAVGLAGLRAVIWTNEDTARENFAKYAMRTTGVPAKAIVDHSLSAEQLRKVVALLGHLPFGVEEAFGLSPREVAQQIENLRPDLAVVDHLHAFSNMSRTQDIDDAVSCFTNVAGRAQCHVILVCQLNAERVKVVCKPPPVARDLRGSGKIFFAAHTVMVVYRQEEEILDPSGRPMGRAVKLDDGHIEVLKNKPGGEEGAVPMLFVPGRLRFTEKVVQPYSDDPF